MSIGQENKSRFAAITVAVFAAGSIFYWGAKHPAWLTFDDAFITYRYADNLRQGLGLVYNPGEWVLGTTTPLYALLLAGLGLVVSDLQLLGHWLAVLSWIAASWGAIVLLRREGWPRAGLAAGLLLALQPYYLLSLGMETTLVVALMLWTAWAWLGGRKVLAILLAAALILTRQDAALFLLILGLEVWRREKTLPWREAVSVTAIVLPWFLYAFWRYGSILPNSAAAKFGQNELMSVGGQFPFWRELWRAATAEFSIPLTALFVASLLLGLVVIVTHARHFWWLAGYIASYVASYMWLGVATFPWYFVPPLTAVNLVIALGVGFLLGDIRSSTSNAIAGDRDGRFPHLSPWLNRSLQAGGCLLLATLFVGQFLHLRSLVILPDRQPAYVSAGQWLAANTPEQAKVATIEIGLVGYHSQRPIVDTMGLVSRDMTDHQVGWVETLVYAIDNYKPEYVLTLPKTGWDAVVNQWWFRDLYQEVARFEHVTIYERQATNQEPLTATVGIDFVGGLTLREIMSASRELSPGEDLVIWLNISVKEPQPSDLSIRARLLDAQTFESVAQVKSEPFSGWYGSDRWQVGDELEIPIQIPVPANLVPGVYRLNVSIIDPARGGGLPLATAPESIDPDLLVGWLQYGMPDSPTMASNLVEEDIQVQWPIGIELTGLALPTDPLVPGEVFPVFLSWRGSKTISRDLKVFIHLVNQMGEIAAQQDQRPFKGRWPMPAWQPGLEYRDLYEVSLPVVLPVGEYEIRLGLYDELGRAPLPGWEDDAWVWDQTVNVE